MQLYVADANGIPRKVKALYIGDANNIPQPVKALYVNNTDHAIDPSTLTPWTPGVSVNCLLIVKEGLTWFLSNDANLYGTGNNNKGQQSANDFINVLWFYKRASDIKKVVCSEYTTWCLTNDGKLYGCGNNGAGQQGVEGVTEVKKFTQRATNVKDVVCSEYTTWYITNDDKLYGCGDSSVGQQGDGTTGNISTFTLRALNVKDVACCSYSTWYITNDGKLYGTGYNYYGTQGDGTTSNVLTFAQRATNVSKVICTERLTWYITNDGKLYGCGDNSAGQQGLGSLYPIEVKTFTQRATNVKDVVCSNETVWYITNDDKLYGCGYNYFGQQGVSNSSETINSFTQRATNVQQVRCSTNTTWYVTNDGKLYGCGDGRLGQQGNHGTTSVSSFTQRATNVQMVDCSRYSTFYIDNNNNLYGCGSSDKGQQGDGTTNNTTVFTLRNLLVPPTPTTYTLTINPTPSDAAVVLTADGYTQQGNSITVPSGTEVSWSVSKTGYTTQSGTETVTSTSTKSVTLTAVPTNVVMCLSSSTTSNKLLGSTNKGSTWSNVSTLPVSDQWCGVIKANNQYYVFPKQVYTGTTYTYYTSADLSSWTAHNISNPSNQVEIYNVIYNSSTNTWVLYGMSNADDNNGYYTMSGTTPTTMTYRTFVSDYAIGRISVANGRFFASAMALSGLNLYYLDTGYDDMFTSTNGYTWTKCTNVHACKLSNVVYGNGKYLVVAGGKYNSYYSYESKAYTSTNGTTWTEASEPTNSYWPSLAFYNNKFLMYSNYTGDIGYGIIQYSSDGETWTSAEGYLDYGKDEDRCRGSVIVGYEDCVVAQKFSGYKAHVSTNGTSFTTVSVAMLGSYDRLLNEDMC